MKEIINKAFNKKTLEPILIFLGAIAVIDWGIFPLLTAASTFHNVMGLVIAGALSMFIGVYIKEKFLN